MLELLIQLQNPTIQWRKMQIIIAIVTRVNAMGVIPVIVFVKVTAVMQDHVTGGQHKLFSMFTLESPLNIQVEITENCNHKCFYCYNAWQITDSSAIMSKADCEKLIDIIADEIKPFHVTITGGEPFLNQDILKRLLLGLNDKNIFTNINTNLTILNENLIKQFRNSFKFGILTSLPHFENDKFKEITKSNLLPKFYQNLEIILRHKIPVTINMVVHKLNYQDVYRQGEFLFKKFGITNFAATPVICPAIIELSKEFYELSNEQIIEVLDQLLKLSKDFKINVDSLETLPRCLMPEHIRNNDLNIFNRACSAGRSTLSIDYKGNVRACSHSPFKESNIFTEQFVNVWSRFSKYRNNEYVPDECKKCDDFFNCYGGCRFYDYKKGEPKNKRDPRMGDFQSIKRETQNIPIPEFDNNTTLTLNSNIKYRKEKENLYIFFNGDFRNILMLNSSFKEILIELQEIKQFTLENFYTDFRIENKNQQKFRNLMKILITKKYVFMN